MRSRLFGTDGIRGLANQYPMTAEVAFNLGRSIGYYHRNQKNKNILIGKDTRISGDMIEAALTAGLCSSGINILKAGIITTPAVAYLTNFYQAIMGIVISASHNPYQDNGIKIFQGNGYKLKSQQEKQIENILIEEKFTEMSTPGAMIGKVTPLTNARGVYLDHITNSIPEDFQKPDYQIVLDCANGSASQIAVELFERLKFNFKVINNSPDGININKKCGSTNMKKLQHEVINERADLGLAFDGDADRVLAVDEKGQIVDGDQIMVIYANRFIKKGLLGNNTIVTTYMSNLGFDETISEMGGKVIRTDIGDKYVLRKMITEKSLLGGEQSGHIIFLLHGPNGDGIMTSFQLLYALGRTGERISVQATRMKKYHQKLLNYQVTDKNSFLNSKSYKEMKREINKNFKNSGRVLIRPSGTENKIRVLLESIDKKNLDYWEKILNEFINQNKDIS